MTQKLRDGFEFNKKACFVCGSLNHLIKDYNFYENKMIGKSMLNNMGRVTGQREVTPVWNNAQRVNHQNKLTHPHPKRNFVSTAVATKSGLVPVNVAKQTSPRAAASISTARHVNTVALKPKVNAASPTKYSYFKAHSALRRPFNQKSVAKTNNFNKKVYTAKVNNVTTAGPEVVVSTAEGKRENAVKSSACWIWRPTGKVIDHISKDSGSYMPKRFDYGNPQYALQDQGIFDSGCSRHMTGNKSYLTDYQDIDGGFVAFAGSPKGGKITGKGKIRTGKLDFEDVYFVKELKFNLFSVSQMCDKKNSVLFTETECLVLSPDFKLLDESQVLLKVPRQNNMYSFDLKNVVPSGVTVGNQTNKNARIKDNVDVVPTQQYILLPLLYDSLQSSKDAVADDAGKKTNEESTNKGERNGQENEGGASNKEDDQNVQDFRVALDNLLVQHNKGYANNTNIDSTVSPSVSAAGQSGAYDDEEWVQRTNVYYTVSTGGMLDDIIFGLTKKYLCTEFESLMHKKFQMSSMGELNFFLGLQVMQIDDGIFISQDQYVADILKKFDFVTIKTTSTLTETNKALLKDEKAEDVDVHLYRSMIRSLIYMKGQPKLGLWYPRDSPFDLESFSNSDYAGASLDRKSTTGDETVIKEWEDRMERAATTASSLEAEQDSGNINRTQSMATLNESFPQGTNLGSGPRCQDTILGVQKLKLATKDMGEISAAPTDLISYPFKLNIIMLTSKKKHELPPSMIYLKDGEDIMLLTELMESLTPNTIKSRALETQNHQALEIESLKRRVKSLEKRRKSRTPGFKRLRKAGSVSKVESSNDVSLGSQEDASK
ncbi:ribonuclease H-like domain-containing protein [Tanacetum coccineum]